MKQLWLFCLGMIFLVGCGGESPPSSAPATTSIPVGMTFQPFYQQYGGEHVFGPPLTEPFTTAPDTPTIQYFTNARFDWNGQTVQVHPLGQWAYDGLLEHVPATTESGGRAEEFSTGFVVQDAFLDFYEQYEGTVWLGEPISAQLNEGGIRVQYFVNGRLEWQPQLPPQQRVQLSQMGRKHFDAEMSYAYREVILAGPVLVDSLTDIEVLASLQSPIYYEGDPQSLFVTVLSPEGKPVMGLTVEATMTHKDGTERLELPLTNDKGQTQAQINMGLIEAGQDVQITITVLNPSGQPMRTKMLSFQTWW